MRQRNGRNGCGTTSTKKMKTKKFYHQTSSKTDPDQLLRMYWPYGVFSNYHFYDCDRGWQIAAVVEVENRMACDKADRELWNMLFDCDEAKGEINITVK